MSPWARRSLATSEETAVREKSAFQELMEMVSHAVDTSSEAELRMKLAALHRVRKSFVQDLDLVDEAIRRIQAALRQRR